MPILEDLKEYAERASGLKRPGKRKASNLARIRKPRAVRFKDDGLAPNHPRWPLIIYRGAVDLDERHDPAADPVYVAFSLLVERSVAAALTAHRSPG